MTVRCRLVLVLAWWVFAVGSASLRAATFLFDATKAESAGNANWVIDEDNRVAGRFPTPDASGITADTPETYWTGALSSWGVALVQLGHSVEQLPVGGRITYGDPTNAQDLSRYQVYVVCEPNILFTAAEKSAMIRYVQEGGSLFVISDHAGSDRNNDGADSVQIWNDFFGNNGLQANPFGVAINSVSVSLTSSYVDTAADDPLTNGVLGPVTQLKYSSGATLTISPTANPSVRAAFWSAASHTNSNVMSAYGTFGAGRFAVLGDSSPPDDGTGSPGHTLYPGWTELGVNHSRLCLNASLWLAAGGNGGVPYNDNFANAARLDPGATTASGTNVKATKETGEPNHAGDGGGASVWWQFTAANGGTASISTQGSEFDTLLAVYTGTTVSTLTPIASNDAGTDASAVSFPVAAGTIYRVAVDGEGGETGHVTLSLALPGPINDNFANATAVSYSGTAVTLTGNNYNATTEAGEPSHAGVAGGRSVWWRWTAPSSGAVTVSTANSSFDTLLAVYTGTAVNALTAVVSNDNYGTSLQGLVSFNAVAGTTYRVAVDGKAGAMGTVSLAFSPGSTSNVPVNDNFANASPLAGANATANATTTYATKETGEPSHGGSSGGHSVWWRWTAPADGTVVIDTIGSSFDTTLGVYTGTAVNALTTLASDDDSGGNLKSKVTVPVTADSTYFIAVDGYGSSAGSATLNLSFTGTPPANDNFANAAVLSGASASGSSTNTYATLEANEPDAYGYGHTVWWRWTASDVDTTVKLSTAGSSFVPSLTVYTGTSINNLTGVAYASSQTTSFYARAGVTYFIQASASGANGTGSIALALLSRVLPVASLVATTPDAYERGTTPGVLTVTFDRAVATPTTLQCYMSGNDAAPGADYTCAPAVSNGLVNVTVPANQTSATIVVTPVDDGDPSEGDEFIYASLQNGDDYLTSTTYQAQIVIHDNTPYSAAWLNTYRSPAFTGANAAPAADPDGDGVPNLLEFAFDTNPTVADAAVSLPVAGTMSLADPADPTGATTRRYLTLTFLRRTDAPNLKYNVETTTDPAGGQWRGDGAAFVSFNNAGASANTTRATYRSTQPMDGPNAVPRQWMRVRVTAP